MAARKLDRTEWQLYFDRVSKALIGRRAEIETALLRVGDQVAARWVPVRGIVYDHKNDMIEIDLDGLIHMVRNPRELFLDHGPAGLASIEMVDGESTRQTVRFHEPLAVSLPAHIGN